MSRNPHEPTEKDRNVVKIAKACGILEESICRMLEIDRKTLKKYYSAELDGGLDDLNKNVAGALYNKAIKGDTTAMIFWLKTRAGWRERDREEQKGEELKPLQLVVKNAKP